MYYIEITTGPDQGKKMKLRPGENLLIGRDLSVFDLDLSDPKVSHRHVELKMENDGTAIIRDLGSTNGTYLRGIRLQKEAVLLPGEAFRIGETSIQLKPGVLESPAALSTGTHMIHEGTVYIAAAKHERQHSIKKGQQATNIGRAPNNDLVLDHPMVSRYHATIQIQNEEYTIIDLNSSNGTYVNGHRVVRKTLLYPDSLIQICGYRFFFDGQELIEYDENKGQVCIELSGLSKTVNAEGGHRLTILDKINLTIEPSEFVAIVGGSGTGKSTLLGAMTGMRPATGGRIYINGRDFYDEYNIFRSMIGYVPQDDIVHLELTVSEVLTYAAQLRMPPDTAGPEIQLLVDEVMENLELTERRDALVKQLSGGQRKRVSIGVELLTKPSLFFLDEPTSGLDPGLEKTMMEMMRRLSDQGRTIILVTHATQNITLCDKIVFMAEGGRLAFYGSPAEALAYFETGDFAEIYKKISTNKSAEEWAATYAASDTAQRQALLSAHSFREEIEEDKGRKQGVSSIKQWSILTARYGKIMARDHKNILLLLLQPVVIAALIVMTFFFSSPTFEFSEYVSGDLEITDTVLAQGRMQEVLDINEKETFRRFNMTISVAIMVFSAIWLGTSNAAREIVKEASIYKRERLVNLRIGPYLLSKVAVLSVVCLVQALLFVSIICLGLHMPVFGLNIAAFFLISLASVMMGLTISAVAADANTAISAVPLLLVPQIILSGAIIPVEKVKPEILQWVFYLAVSKWGYELVGGDILDVNGRVALESPVQALSGNLAGHWWVLLGWIILLFTVSAFVLRRKDVNLD